MKKSAIVVMVLGVLVAGLGIAWPYQSDSASDCLRFRAKAVALLEEASQVAGTPREQELMEEAEGETTFADGACERADAFRNQGYMIVGGGVLLLVVGFVLSRKKAASAS